MGFRNSDYFSRNLVVCCATSVLNVARQVVTATYQDFTCFHIPVILILLFAVECDFKTATELAVASVFHAFESSFEQVICELNAYQLQQPLNTDEDVDFVAVVVNSCDLYAEAAIDFL